MRASAPPRVTPSGGPGEPAWPGRTTASVLTPTSAPQSSPSALPRAPADSTASARGEMIVVMGEVYKIFENFLQKSQW